MAELTTKPVPLAPPPRRSVAIESRSGLFGREWLTWFELMWKRQGEAHAPSNDELGESLVATQGDLTALQAELGATQADLAQTQAALAQTQADLDTAEASLVALQTELDATQDEIDALLPEGPARTLTRYQADGSGIETTPGLATTADGKLGIGVPVPVEQLEVAGGLTVGAATATAANGTMQWNGTDLQGRLADAWVSLTVGASSVLPGPVHSVARYVAPGTSVDEAPGVWTSANAGQLHLTDQATAPSYSGGNALTIDRDGSTQVLLTVGGASSTVGAGLILRSAPGTLALPTATQEGTRLGYLTCGGHDGTTYKGTTVQLLAVGSEAWTTSANGSALRLLTVLNGGLTATENLRLDGSGNLTTTGAEVTSGLKNGLALKSGTAPASGHPVDAIQVWVKDIGAVAGKAGLHVRSEDGGTLVVGTQTGVGTLCDVAIGTGETYRRLNVRGAQLFVNSSSVQERPQALLEPTWIVSTDASRRARVTLQTFDATAAREGLRLESSGTAPLLGVLGAAAVGRQTVPVAAVDPATTMALVNSLRTALVTFGFCV